MAQEWKYNTEEIAKARQALDDTLARKPGAYQSKYETQLGDTMNRILNREKFNYDMNADALYQQYKDQYTRNGKLAMQNTMGQAAALTGGYGNSYAQQAGQQAYQGYLQGLNDKLPELYQLALSRYNQEGDRLNEQYNILNSAENRDYGRHQDALAAWQNDRSYYDNGYQTERNLGYQMGRDAVQDSQWERQFNESVRQWQAEFDLRLAAMNAGGGGGGGGGGGSRRSSTPTALSDPQNQADYNLAAIRGARSLVAGNGTANVKQTISGMTQNPVVAGAAYRKAVATANKVNNINNSYMAASNKKKK